MTSPIPVMALPSPIRILERAARGDLAFDLRLAESSRRVLARASGSGRACQFACGDLPWSRGSRDGRGQAEKAGLLMPTSFR